MNYLIAKALVVAAAFSLSACGDAGFSAPQGIAANTGGGGQSSDRGPSVQERADSTFGNTDTNENVTATDDTTTADSATGNGGQSAGDAVPSQSVSQSDLSGTPVSAPADAAGAPDSGVTENGNDAPGFD